MEEFPLPKRTTGSRPEPGVCWVSPEWLEDHRQDPGLIILDVRQNSHAYFTGHIPGALYLHEAHLRGHIGGIPVRWIPPAAAEYLFSSLGIEAEQPVVVYSEKKAEGSAPGSGDGLEQYLVAYSLARYGCRDVKILDGGLGHWSSPGHLPEHKFGFARLSAFRAEVRPDFFISQGECAHLKDRPGTILLDTRPAAWYEGQGPWIRPGHIPGAISLPAGLLLDPDNPARVRPENELRSVLESREITPEKTIICSCGTGRTAAAVFLILRFFLGYPDVVMFEGGFTEWSAIPGNPVVTGKSPR
jgi:thiosulfate/3-mercaptopyruvate sulfurtransferase